MESPVLISYSVKKAFSLRSRIKKGCPLLPVLIKIVLDVLSSAIMEGKETHQNWKRKKMISVHR